MSTLVFTGNTTLEEVFHTNAVEIYDALMQKIKNNLDAPRQEKIRVATIQVNNLEYQIDLPRGNFGEALQKACLVFQEYEITEKCVECESLKEKVTS